MLGGGGGRDLQAFRARARFRIYSSFRRIRVWRERISRFFSRRRSFVESIGRVIIEDVILSSDGTLRIILGVFGGGIDVISNVSSLTLLIESILFIAFIL